MAAGVPLVEARGAGPPPPAEARDDSHLYEVEQVVGSLADPASIAVRPGAGPGPYELYISESGAGRVVRMVTEPPDEPHAAITGFDVDASAAAGALRAGPLGLAFLSRNRLAVGTGGLADGADVIRVYSLPDTDGELTYDQADHSAGPVPASSRSQTGEGDFASLASTERAVFVACRSGDAAGWVLKAVLDANRVAGLEPFVATRTLINAGSPTAVAIDARPRRHYLLIAAAGEPDANRDSRVAWLSPTSGELALTMNVGLYDAAGLAYSPSGDLYAIDLATARPDQGGVYRIESAEAEGRESCRAVKVAAAERPTALAFTPDGVLYVTVAGKPEESGGGDPPRGALLRITPKSETPRL